MKGKINFVMHKVVIFKGMPKWNASPTFWDIQIVTLSNFKFMEVGGDF